MPSAPYWGDLSGPKAARRQRRQSEDFSLPDRKPSPDQLGLLASDSNHPSAPAPASASNAPVRPPKSNRTSLQTTNTEAVTESTLSPYASPTASSFADQGLAPRPPTFPYGESQYPEDLQAERRQRRRRERNEEEPLADRDYLPVGATPPAAPDVPKAPPVSFRHPYGNGGLPYTYPAPAPGPSRPPRHPSPLVSPDDDMNPEGYYRDAAPEMEQQQPPPVPQLQPPPQQEQQHQQYQDEEYPPLDRSQRTLDTNETRPPRTSHGSSRRRSEGQSRKVSGGGSSRKFANDRSPLQRLELTLDSITKEEKRARVEAAERRAREKAAAAAAKNPQLLQAPEPTHRAPRSQPAPAPQQPVQPPPPQIKQEPQRPLPEPPQQPPVSVPQVRFSDVTYDDDDWRSAAHEQQANVAAPRGAAPQYHSDDRRYAPGRQSLDDRRRHHQYEPEDDGRYESYHYQTGVPTRAATTRQPPVASDAIPQRSFSLREESRQPPPSSSGIPKRNLSFRERAAKNDMNLPTAAVDKGQSPEVSPEPTPPVKGSRRPSWSLVRSGSNKLKKQPKGDPWFNIRKDAEKKYENIDVRNAALDESAAAMGGPVKRSASHATREQALPQDAVAHEEVRRAGIPSKAAKLIGIDLGGGGGGVQRRATAPSAHRDYETEDDARYRPVTSGGRGDDSRHVSHQEATDRGRQYDREYYSEDEYDERGHRISNKLYHGRDSFRPGEGIYKAPKYLDEWKKATVGSLTGSLLELSDDQPSSLDKGTPWWEGSGKRRGSASRPRKAEAFDGEYDETNAPTRFKPPLYLKCGPLLRYCGLKHEKVPPRTRDSVSTERTLWRGSVMIVTQDSDSSYEIAPTLRLFAQPLELLPPPPQVISGEQDLPPEYVDPIAGMPKLGRRGETLYVRPVDHLEEAKDLSRDETDNGLFEKTKSPPDVPPVDGSLDYPGSFSSRRKRVKIDGEKVSKYKDVRGFRLHAERGYTFWRFNIEIELREKQQRIAYRINRGPSMGFWVPAAGESMNIMFYSCNGFSMSVNPDDFSGPDPLWRDVLNNHQSQPFHVMLGGGDQIYNDCLMDQSKQFREWLMIKNPLHKHNAPFTAKMQDELETAYLERYCMWFSQGLFGLANSQIPMVNMWDDHDISDGFGSYAHHDMNSPVFSGLGNVAYKYYMLFQHQSIPDETESTEPSWVVGTQPGPYINELSRSLFIELGSKVSLLAVDARTERTESDVISEATWQHIMDRCYDELRNGRTQHLLVLLGVPIAYPRLVWLENILTSRAMDPVKALGKLGMLGNALNHIDGGVEVLDDLNDHWTAKNHKKEREIVIQDMQDLAADKSVRVTFLSGDVHLAAVGQFYANPKLNMPKHKDFRYMPNVISSAIVNTPPPDLMADILNKRNKIHHFDDSTDENMIPLFNHGVDGKSRNNKHLLPHRNWCMIREWTPGTTPPPTPPLSAYDGSPSPPPSRGGGLLRRFSSNRGAAYRPDLQRDSPRDSSRPPIANSGKTGGLFRRLSRRNSTDGGRPAAPAKPKRSLSLTRNFFSRKNSKKSKPDDGGINGSWGEEDDDHSSVEDGHYGYDQYDREPAPRSRGMGLRGGGAHDDYQPGDDSYFTARPATRARGAAVRAVPQHDEYHPGDESQFTARPPQRPRTMSSEFQGSAAMPPPKPFHRTPTGISVKQQKQADKFAVDLEGGLDICLNVEVNPKDPTGITTQYRLLVPRLFWDDAKEGPALQQPAPAGFKRFFSQKKKNDAAPPPEELEGDDDEYYDRQVSGRSLPQGPPAGRDPMYDVPRNARYEPPGRYDSPQTYQPSGRYDLPARYEAQNSARYERR